ncbi:unnamed protein product, partial [Meganyctiphanes norvegica]
QVQQQQQLQVNSSCAIELESSTDKLTVINHTAIDRASSNRDVDPCGHTFKKGSVYKGIYLPTLTNSFREYGLESAYQRYSHRQRQKSLIMVNGVDLSLKVALLVIFFLYDRDRSAHLNTHEILKVCHWVWWMLVNVVLCVMSWRRCFTNKYLHWGALTTWLVLNIQG